MEKETISKFSDIAEKKASFLNNSPVRYFVYSMLAGIYVGLGIILIFSIGAPLSNSNDPLLKTIMGASFSVALTLVIFAGSELFTGNNMIMTIGALQKRVSWFNAIKIWIISFAGNLLGSIFVAYLMFHTGFLSVDPLNSFIVNTTASKMTVPFKELFFRGILCNMLVCLAVWTAGKAKEETAKLILIFWCLFAFIGSGFEHSIANMTLLAMGLFAPHTNATVTWAGYFNNLFPVTIGNMIGGAVIIGFAYWFISSDKITKEN